MSKFFKNIIARAGPPEPPSGRHVRNLHDLRITNRRFDVGEVVFVGSEIIGVRHTGEWHGIPSWGPAAPGSFGSPVSLSLFENSGWIVVDV